MKKLFVLLLVTVFSISLFNSCGSAEEKKDDSTDTKDKVEEKAKPEFILKCFSATLHDAEGEEYSLTGKYNK